MKTLARVVCCSIFCTGFGVGFSPDVQFDWQMLDQFSGGVSLLDPLRRPIRGLVDDGGWQVLLTAYNTDGVRYEWYIYLPTGVQYIDAAGTRDFVYRFPKLGLYRVALNMTRADGSVGTLSKYISLRRILIVSLGDSIASGEGNPNSLLLDEDGREFWRPAIEGNMYSKKNVIWADRRCHRSNWSGPARASVYLWDPHYSVIFLSVACSGASISMGLLNGYSGAENPDDLDLLPSQIDNVADLLCPKPLGGCTRDELPNIDALLLQVGGNDVGFGDIVEKCAYPFSTCSDDSHFTSSVKEKLDNLPKLYGDLDLRLRTALKYSGVYIAEYPDATYAPNGLTICNEIVFEDAGLFGIDGVINSDEIVWAHFNLIQPLNARVRGAAMANNWTLVGSIEKDFATHGYCSSPSERRWIRRFGDSLEIQADDRGTLHPNIYGHDVYAKRIAAALEPIRARAAALPGDLNLDGKVDCSDLKTVRDLLGKRMGQLGFDPIADLNQDGMIDLTDLAIVAQNLPAGARCP